MEHNLLPAADEAVRCSVFAQGLNLSPVGSGQYLERVILVSVATPWPKPALGHPTLAPLATLVNASAVATRLFAAEPTGENDFVEVYERHGTAASAYRWSITDADDRNGAVAAIASCPVGELESIPGARSLLVGTDLPPTFLVCTQGSHDLCCGEWGVKLADELAQTTNYEIRRVSHTGGHRFAPTLLAFPEGRMWAFVDASLVERIALRQPTADDYVSHCRGWWGAPGGAAQVAEVAVRAELAASPFVEPTIKERDEPPQNGERQNGHQLPPRVVEVHAGDRSWEVEVRVDRLVPSIACEAPGGQPAKPGREFGWSIKSVEPVT